MLNETEAPIAFAATVESRPMKVDGLQGQPDAALLILIRRGDIDALEVIYDRYIDILWRVALAFSEASGDAERAVSAAFKTLWLDAEPSEPASLAARLLASVWREASRGAAASIPPH